MKTPTKAELRAEIAELKKVNANLQRQLTKEKHKQWLEKKEQAVNMLYRSIPFLPREVRNLTLDHIDESGYWFNFELEPSGIKQTYCIRHTDL